jgi:2-polyprenyl-3-methyl-5-hydroxy-6-metoxy-1,4-benzoquinol methylase
MTDFLSRQETASISMSEVFRLIRYKLEDPRQDAITEIGDYLKLTPSDVEKNFKIGELARHDWNKNNPSSQSQVEDYYKSTYGYIYDLMAAFYELRDQNIHLINNLITLIRQARPSRILDFGGGAGCYTLPIKALGAPVHYADLAGETARFARWRFEQRHMNVPVLDAGDWDRLGSFDFIYAFSVLEHTYDPVAIMRNLKPHLAPKGLIYLQNDFSAIEPMHLEKNLPYAATFDRELRSLGYEIVTNYSNGLMVLTSPAGS